MPSQAVCVEKDIEHKFTGWKDVTKAPVEKFDGEAYFQSDGTVIENGKSITMYGKGSAAVIFDVKDNADGKPATYRYDFGGDLQPLCANLTPDQKLAALAADITNTFKRKDNPVNSVVIVTVDNNGKAINKTITRSDWAANPTLN